MIYSVGTDIVRIERIKSFIEKGGMDRIFTTPEKEHCEKSANLYETAAGIFAAKEAFSKAVGTGISSILLKDVELNYDNGRPFFNVRNEKWKELSFNVSISHDGEYAVAFVVAERSVN